MGKAKTGFDITKQQLSVYLENFYFDAHRGAFVALYEYSFDPDDYFGTSINKPNGAAHLCFLTEWDTASSDISMYYYGDFEESSGKELEKGLTEKEKEFFRQFMDQYCLVKYGRSILDLHCPMTDEERCFFLDFDSLEQGGVDAYGHTGDDDMDDGADDDTMDSDEDPADEEDLEFDVRVALCISLPETCAQDDRKVMADITAAFAHADIEDWLADAETDLDDDIIEISFVTSIMGSDGSDAENYCIGCLEEAEGELNAAGYQILNLSCTAEEI
ncbi:MAG: hypothetical protein NC489_31700 [Ruminococcus flavefaciens]|nr:hypothetical protein [Ruminococcus flavefaciens]